MGAARRWAWDALHIGKATGLRQDPAGLEDEHRRLVLVGAHQGISHPLAQNGVEIELAKLMMRKAARALLAVR